MPIETPEEFEKWLKEQPRQTCVLIAARAALRVFPIITHPHEFNETCKTLTLFAARAILTSGVAAKSLTPEIKVAAVAASDAVASAAEDAYTEDGGAAADAADSAHYAAGVASDVNDATAYAGGAATGAADAAYSVTYADPTYADTAFAPAYIAAYEATYADAEISFDDLLNTEVWHTPDEPDWLVSALESLNNLLDSGPEWAFWREWYQGFLDGKPMDWELQRRVALIDEAIWEAGPEPVAAEIERIRAAFENGNAAVGPPSAPKPVTENEKNAISQRVLINRDALSVSVAGLLEQLAEFKERVRSINHLEAEFREELLEFVDGFSSKLEDMLGALPQPGESLREAKAEKLALWLREYRTLMRTKLAHYASPENLTEATVPTGIVLAATGVGAMFGAPLTGSVVGGLIANQVKPGQAAKELMKPNKPDADTN